MLKINLSHEFIVTGYSKRKAILPLYRSKQDDLIKLGLRMVSGEMVFSEKKSHKKTFIMFLSMAYLSLIWIISIIYGCINKSKDKNYYSNAVKFLSNFVIVDILSDDTEDEDSSPFFPKVTLINIDCLDFKLFCITVITYSKNEHKDQT